ncbi:MAG: hypothetical protein JSV00_05335, partial [bacterium]
MILDEYPKTVNLRDGSRITLRPMIKEDEKILLEFFQGLSEGDRLYLRDDVADPAVVRGWVENIDYQRVLPILAIDEGKVVADATLHRNVHSW